jgi:hypothetical protein
MSGRHSYFERSWWLAEGSRSLLSNPYVIALGVPIVLILSSAFAKKLVRGSAWTRTDFFLGVELAMAAIASALTNFLDVSRAAASGNAQLDANGLAKNGAFLAICFFLLLVILATHQEWEKKIQAPTAQFLWLGAFCNAIGATLVISFILLVKGV